jgi:hypothetical protein
LTLLGGTYTGETETTTVGCGTCVTATGGGTTGTVTGTTVVVAPLGVFGPGELHESAAKTMPTSASTPTTALPMMLRELARRGCVIAEPFLAIPEFDWTPDGEHR